MQRRTSDTHPIAVDWLVESPARIGLTIAPGKHAPSRTGAPWARDLASDLDRLVDDHRAAVLVCLLEAEEMERLRIPTLLAEARARGLEVHWLPIRDGRAPHGLDAARGLVDAVVARARAGAPVVIHCQGGVGRAGTIGGCALVRLGMGVAEAIATLKERRDPRSPETSEQAEFIARFARMHEAEAPPEARFATQLTPRRAGACGAVMGAAIGDAMGHPTEFLPSLALIRERFGARGVTGFELYWERDGDRFAPYTDDTQMAEIVLRALCARDERDDLERAMQRIAAGFVGWMRAPQGGHRAPGNACLAGAEALARGVVWSQAGGAFAGGCGSVMRAYPFGVVFCEDLGRAEAWAVEHSKLTHRDPIALAACSAMAIGTALSLVQVSVRETFEEMIRAARSHDATTADMLARAWDEARAGVGPDVVLDRLRGWAAHEAIAAALYIVARHPTDPASAILEGANTPGDSDSIASLVGALVGARNGLAALPEAWVRDVERSGALLALALEATF